MTKFNLGPKDALLRIDLINAFGPKGGLPVVGGDEITQGVNELSQQFYDSGALVVDVQDWHPRGHGSFASTHGVPPYSTVQMSYGDQTAWPDHAIQNTWDSEFFADLDTHLAHLVIRKGFNPKIDSYSAFFENDRATSTGLAGYLRDRNIERVFIVGLAYDFCVGFSALDARRYFMDVIVLKDLTRGIDLPTDTGGTVADMERKFRENDVVVANSTDAEIKSVFA